MQHKTKLILILFFLVGVLCFAQSPPIPEVDGRAGPVPPGTPIDGGLGILLAAGIYYGIKKSLKK